MSFPTRVTEAGRDFIAGHEGVVLKAYRDVGGVMTIGVGHTAAAGAPIPVPGMTISREEAMRILTKDFAKFERRVARTGAFKAQAPFDGAVSFDFNTGRIHNASWVPLYANDLFVRAEASLMQWVKAGGRSWPGLKRRRKAEADLIFRGSYASGTAEAAKSTQSDDVLAYQKQLTALKIYGGALDGIAGPQTKAAVLDFQRAHPHLTADGIVGPATRASLQRAVNALKAPTVTGASSAAAGGSVGAAADKVQDPASVGGVDPVLVGGTIALVVLVAVGAFYAWRYRDEIRLFLKTL